MSTVSVSNIVTANGSENLSITTGNTTGSKITVNAAGGLTVASNSTVNVMTIYSNSGVILRPNNALGTAGQVLISNSIGGVYFANSIKIALKETLYAANATFTKDANLVSLVVYCVGAGGGGGGSNGLSTAANAQGASGGGGGGVAVKILQNAEVGSTSNVVVGIGGTGGGSWISAGGNGSNSTFANSTGGLITGQGGTGASAATIGTGGNGLNGDLNLTGSDGNQGWGNSIALAISISGGGGASGMAFGAGASGVRSSANGINGDLYGGGGGGSASTNNSTAPVAKAGGNGANGLVWIQEYYYTTAV